MLEKILEVKGIGLLHDASGSQHTLKKASFIYADNGSGKSTLASILHSCSIQEPSLILNRRTLNEQTLPKVKLLFSHGQLSTFQNSSWDNPHPEILVFDNDFVERNVYAGSQVTTDQRKNLLGFALGTNAVDAQNEYDQANTDATNASSQVRSLTTQLNTAHQGLTLAQFQGIEEVSDAEDQIHALNSSIAEAERIGAIQAKNLPQRVVSPAINIDPIFQTLMTSLTDIDVAAEKRVKQHIDEHKKPKLEQWISDGQAYDAEEKCLFCNQPLDGVDLIDAYRSYFNKDYKELKLSVSQLNGLISTHTSENIINSLQTSFTNANSIIDGWKEHIEEIPSTVFDIENAKQIISDIKTSLEALADQKASNLLDAIGSDEEKQEILGRWQEILGLIESGNLIIDKAISCITKYKEDLTSIDIASLRQQIINFEWSKTRYREDIVDLITQLGSAKTQETSALTLKETKKIALTTIMTSTLQRYTSRINTLLNSFGAQFTIPEIKATYQGGPRSNYVLQMRGTDIELSTNNGPNFKTALSEGDKRTLAFAFFIASTESDPDLQNKIIVIDDPMCSLDLNRKRQTRTVLKRIHDNCKQLIILAHDIHFIRNLRDDLTKARVDPQDIACFRLKSVTNRYSDFNPIDIDHECESAYYKHHRSLNDFLEGRAANSIDVAKSIRPMMEGYLHRKFPGKINSGLLFGQVIDAIRSAQAPNPLIHAQSIVDELNEINLYAGMFHHDTNPGADQVDIVDGELRTYVERALKVIHRGVV